MSSNLLSTKEAIEKRRSIRNFKEDSVSNDVIMELIESARLAPSGCNSQPWRFKIVKDLQTKSKLQEIAYNQKWISSSVLLIVLCTKIVKDKRGAREIQKKRDEREMELQ